MKQTIKKGVAIFVALTVIQAATASLASAENSNVTGGSATTVSRIQSSIHDSLSSLNFPSNLTPSIKSLLATDKYGNPGTYLNQGTSLVAKCRGSNSEYKFEPPKPCFFGNLNSKRTIVLWGDSSAGSWVPAMIKASTALKLRLAVLVAHGCGLQDWTPAGTTLNAGCEKWRKALPRVIGKLKPKAIIASTLGMGVYSKLDSDKIAQAWSTTFSNLTRYAPKALRIFLGSTPVSNLGKSLVSCLSLQQSALGYPKALVACSPPADGWPIGLMQESNRASSIQARATLIDTLPWFCTNIELQNPICPIVIGKNLVYVDADHISIAYSKTLGTPLRESLVLAGVR